jgi:lipoprotein-anchoring transpeptidase ErfK/SrfK
MHRLFHVGDSGAGRGFRRRPIPAPPSPDAIHGAMNLSRFLVRQTPLFCLILCGLSGTGLAAKKPRTHQQIEEATRLQIFLDNADFGPGKIDGQGGEFTQKAAALYRQSKGENAPAATGPKAPINTAGMDLASVNPVFIAYIVTKDDAANVGNLPSGPEAESKVKRLPYKNVAEGIAEKFHSSVQFLKELNPGKIEKLKEGDPVTVPNVKPFELNAVKAIQPGAEAAAVIANELGEESGAAPSEPPSPGAPPSTPKENSPAVSLNVSVKENMLTVHAGEKVVAAFPVTVGSQQTVSPIGHWVVKAIAKMPNFRWDLKMLKEGERSSHFHLLPPGPNNPVGVLWIALNKKGIGIHGTDDPESIGRNASHGCIRLANWDIVKLAGLVKPGTAVTVE